MNSPGKRGAALAVGAFLIGITTLTQASHHDHAPALPHGGEASKVMPGTILDRDASLPVSRAPLAFGTATDRLKEAVDPTLEAGSLVVSCLTAAWESKSGVEVLMWESGVDPRAESERGVARLQRHPLTDPEGTHIGGLRPDGEYSLMLVGGGWVSPRVETRVVADGGMVRLDVERLYGARILPVTESGAPIARPRNLCQEYPVEHRNRLRAGSTYGPSSVQAALIDLVLRGEDGASDPRNTLYYSVPISEAAPTVRCQLSIPGYLPVQVTRELSRVVTTMPDVEVALTPYADASGLVQVKLSGVAADDREIFPMYEEARLRLNSQETEVDGRAVCSASPLFDLAAAGGKPVEVPAGSYRSGLRMRNWRMLGLHPQEARLEAPLEVHAGGTSTVTYELGSVGGLEVEAIQAGRGYSGPLEVVLRREGSARECPIGWHRGPYLLRAMPPGHYEVALRPGFSGTDPVVDWPVSPLEVRAGEVAGVTLSVPGGAVQ